MSHLLDPLEPGLLQALGRQGRLEQFAPLLEPPDPATGQSAWRYHWQPSVHPDQRLAASAGVLLMFQRSGDPPAQPEQTQWALRGITLHTALSPLSAQAWTQVWPANLSADKTTRQDLRALFGEPTMQTPGLSIFAIKGPQEQRWGLQCQFDQAGRLQTFTITHLDPWQPLPEAQADPEPEPAAAPSATCFSGGAVPRTGWYEGQLPPEHPGHAIYGQLDARFAYREAGQRMTRLGVQPDRDEALVVWTWMGEQLPEK